MNIKNIACAVAVSGCVSLATAANEVAEAEKGEFEEPPMVSDCLPVGSARIVCHVFCAVMLSDISGKKCSRPPREHRGGKQPRKIGKKWLFRW